MAKTKAFTLLNQEQIWDSNQLKIFKKYGTKAATTDLAVVLGGAVNSGQIVETSTGQAHASWWWSASENADTDVRVVGSDGPKTWSIPSRRNDGFRPASSFSLIKDLPNGVRGADGILRVKIGQYPQTLATELERKSLDKQFTDGTLKKTGHEYTFDSHSYDEYSKAFDPRTVIEYEWRGEKFVRVECLDSAPGVLSNKEQAQTGKTYWVKVEPITWLVDEDEKIILSERVLFAGIQFDSSDSYNGNFKKTFAHKYLNNYFAKEVRWDSLVNQSGKQKSDNSAKQTAKKAKKTTNNPYNFNFNSDITPKEMIIASIAADEPVFLHGLPGDGKSARVKQVDPDCITLLLASFSLDRLNGKTIFNPATSKVEDIPPAWYDELVEKCQNEPEKNHILFLDELTNALPSIQGEVLTLVQDRKVNGRFKLPSNCRIVAAGNEMEDSEAAYDIIRPLFDRFGHVNIQTTTDNWLPWAAKAGIHPAVYAFIAFNGDGALRTEFSGDPKNPSATPRAWEKVSNELKAGRNPYLARMHVGDIADEFAAFCQSEIISLEDVLSGNYTQEDLDEMQTDLRYLTATCLTNVSDDKLATVRNFVSKLGEEEEAVFDSLWIHGDKDRAMRIAELSAAASETSTKGGISL